LTLAAGDPATGTESLVRQVGKATPVPFNGSVAPVILDPRVTRAIKALLRDFEPDVLHLHEPYAGLIGLAGVRAPVPFVVTFHASVDHWLARLGYATLTAAFRSILTNFGECIAVSESAARSARFAARRDLVIVPNRTHFETPSNATPAALPGGPRLLFLGRLEPRKGLSIALQAFQRLAAARPDLWLIVAGDGSDRQLADTLPAAVGARVRWLGDVPEPDVPSLYAAADVFLAPSTGSESFGITVLDAMAAGTPVVASDIEGYRNLIIDGDTGLLVPPGDDDALAVAIGRILDDPTAAHTRGAHAQERARSYAWPHVAERIEGIYERVLGQAAVAPVTPSSRPRRRSASAAHE
jgi:phosphatidylinositol alpha-mannosyltransferase